MGKLRTLISTVIVLAALAVPILQSGCRTSQLESGGSYAPTNSVGVVVADKPFMAIESAFALAYGTLDTAFSFERDNRAMLWGISHSIKTTLDKIRPQAVAVRNEYFKLRATYISQGTGLADLRKTLEKMERFSLEAQAVLPK